MSRLSGGLQPSLTRDELGLARLTGRSVCAERSMRVRLIKKFANALDGIDLSRWSVGDVVAVTPHEAELLLAEGWAESVADDAGRSSDPPEMQRMRRSIDMLRLLRVEMEEQSQAEHERRRVEDRIREELRDARAKTIPEEPTRNSDKHER